MLGWIKRRAQIAVVNSAKQDIDRFNAGLRGATPIEIGCILACGYHWMQGLNELYGWELLFPEEVVQTDIVAQVKLNRLIREVQSKEQALATGGMIWLHSLRAANIPEIRHDARVMWRLLERGMPYVAQGATTLRLLGFDCDIRYAGLVPAYLSTGQLSEDVA